MTEPHPLRTTLWADLALFAIAIAALWVWDDFREMTITSAGHLGTGIAGVVLWRISARPPHGLYSAPAVFTAVFCAFHLGLTTSLALGVEPTAYLNEATFLWIESDTTVEAMRWSLVGLLALGAGVTIADLRGPRPHPELPWDTRIEDNLGRVGSAMVAFAVASWVTILVTRGGLGIFLGSYMSMRALTEGAAIPYVLLCVNIGVPLLAATRYRQSHLPGLIACGVFVILGFPLGLRGEVLFPAGAALVILARRGVVKPRPRLLIVAAIVVLAASAFVRDLRTSGLTGLGSAEVSSNPFHGLMELGSSLRPVVAVVEWSEAGEDFIGGASYWAPVERAITRFVPIAPRPPADEDERLMNVLVKRRRLGPIGFSPVAEAFRNFGGAGVVGVLGLIGFVVGRIGRWPRVGAWPALIGLVLVPLLNHVRNSFVPVPAQLVAGATVVALVVAFTRIRAPRPFRRPTARRRERA